MKNKRGITLVSLVVTIIILIILSAISINLTLGDNGIITIAKQAKENIEIAKIEEETKLNELYTQIEIEGGNIGETSYNSTAKLIEFKQKIASAITDMGITTLETANADTMASNIRSISGASTAENVSYDNTTSGLGATNVQSAVDELDSELGELNNSLEQCGKVVKIGEAIGTTPINIDSSLYNTFVIYVTEGAYKANTTSITLVSDILTDNFIPYVSGAYSITGFAMCIYASKTQIKIIDTYVNGEAHTNEAKLVVYGIK